MSEDQQQTQKQQIVSSEDQPDSQMKDQTEEVKETYQPSVVGKGDETFIVRSQDEVNKMFDAVRIMQGQKTTDQMKQEWEESALEKSEDINANKVPIPNEIFKEFSEVCKENEEDFKYLASHIIVAFLEKYNDKALEFPACIDGGGRAQIHILCNFLGLASHSTGHAKTRRILVYPRHLFLAKQEAEKARIDKEKAKIREKFKDFHFAGAPNENALTMREKLIREIYYEKKGISDPFREEVWDGPLEVRIEELKKKMKVYEENMKKQKEKYEQDQMFEVPGKGDDDLEGMGNQKFEEMKEREKANGPKILKYTGNLNENADNIKPESTKPSIFKKDEPVKEDGNDSDMSFDSDEYDESYFSTMGEEEKKAYKEEVIKKKELKKQKKLEEFKKRELIEKQLKETTLKTFKDKPEEVRRIRCLHVEHDMFAIEWDAPGDNNSPIKCYHIYISNKKVTTKIITHQGENVSMESHHHEFTKIGTISDDLYYEITGLEADTAYYILVTAENDLGEGYRRQPFMLKTCSKAQKGDKPYQLYVWGNNNNSELCLSDDQVQQTSKDYIKHAMRKVVKSALFDKGNIIDIAPGNCQTIILYVDSEQAQSVIQSGLTSIPIDEQSTQTIFKKNEVVEKLQEIPSIPFAVDFNIPVVRVMCGDLFSGLLTAEGEVFTWGYNIYGQLGLKDQEIAIVTSPQRVKFENPKERIIDIQCGFNHSLALNENKQVFVWGRRMGIYQPFEFNYHGVTQSMGSQVQEINQDFPRLLKGNMSYYKVNKLSASTGNSGLITDQGVLLMSGMNDFGQLAIGEELGKHLYFFHEFMKRDFFSTKKQTVIDIAFGLCHSIILVRDDSLGKNRVFGTGQTKFGQLGHHSALITHDFIEITDRIPGEVAQISCGSFHSMFLTVEGKLFACGKNSKGQLGFMYQGKDHKYQSNPIEIKVPKKDDEKITSIHGGSLYSMALVQ